MNAAATADVAAASASGAATELSLETRGVCHWYGTGELRKQILFDLDFSARRGEILLLNGPSGCGKTTLLTLLGALRHVQQGSARVLGRELHGAAPAELVDTRRHIGFVFQAHNLLDFLTASQNVQMSLQLHGVPPDDRRRRAAEVLGRVGLSHRLDYYPAQLSGGQRQRVSVARALAANPQLILADEPTAALDSVSGRQVVELLQQMAREQGCTVVIVTHDHRIRDVADRIVRMEDGRMLPD